MTYIEHALLSHDLYGPYSCFLMTNIVHALDNINWPYIFISTAPEYCNAMLVTSTR